MSTETSTAPSSITLPLTQQIVALLNALYADGRGFAHAVIGRGQAATATGFPAGRRLHFMPEWILRELEYRAPDDVCLSAATTDQGGHMMLDLTCAWTELVFEPTLDRDHGWCISEADAAAAWGRIVGFGMRPSLIIDGAWTWLCVWLLDRPLALDVPEGLARAERVQRALSIALGGLVDEQQIIQPMRSMGPARYATMPAWHPARPALRLPGSRNRDRGVDGAPVMLATLHPDLRYSIAEISAALGQEVSTS